MSGDFVDSFELEGTWHADTGRYVLVLHHRGGAPLSGFRLAFSGPVRLRAGAPVSGGEVVRLEANYTEIAPLSGFVLAPGESWTIEITALEYPLRHWTDGAVTGFVIREDGSTVTALTRPTRLAGSNQPRRRGTERLPVPETPPVPVSIIPWPREVAVSGRRAPPRGLAIMGDGEATETVADNFAALTQFLFPGEGLVRDDEEGGLPVDICFDRDLAVDEYRIAFAEEGVEIAGGAYTGLLYGLITVGQILRGARRHPQSFVFPTNGMIADSPRFAWRGCHLDVARRFYSSEEIKQFLAILAWNKLNVLHWHLSDDEGFRVEIEAFPELIEKAAFMGVDRPLPPLLGAGPEATGGYYTQDAIRDIVALGEDFGVEIVPEIDMPGHCHALLTALPQLRDPEDEGGYESVQYFAANALNPGVSAVYEITGTIIEELIGLFPSAYFHVGADEVPAGAWSQSPAAEALRAELGVSGAAPLQAHFLQQIQALLTRHDKITGAWEEAAQGGGIDPDNAYLVGWHEVAATQRLAAAGYSVVAAPGQAYYLDMALDADWHECGASWAGASSLRQTYEFTPDEGWSDEERERLMGVQCCIWSEPMSDPGVFDRLVFPRLSAMAETAWTPEASRNFERFSALAGLMPTLYGIWEER